MDRIRAVPLAPPTKCSTVSTARSSSGNAPSPNAKAAPAAKENKSYRLASRAHHAGDSVVEIKNVRIGGDAPFILIAGPCSVESREQITACARALHEAGCHLLRGGCFKPRTSPYDFQGLGFDGLTIMREAADAYGLAILTEVVHPGDVDAVAREADALQLGARNMQNFALLKAVGKTRLPVVLKRGLMSSIDEWLAAAEYIMSEGNARVILCERGIRTFETATRNTLDLSAVPVLRERTHLPDHRRSEPRRGASRMGRAAAPRLARGRGEWRDDRVSSRSRHRSFRRTAVAGFGAIAALAAEIAPIPA